jgi:hypothetical protein
MSEIYNFILKYLDNILSYITGLLTSYILLIIGIKHQRKEEIRSELRRSLRLFHPLLDSMAEDLLYLKTLKSRPEKYSSNYKDIVQKVSDSMVDFENSFSIMIREGYMPELEAVDKELANHLNGLFNITNKKDVEINTEILSEKALICNNLLESFLKK